MMTIAFRKMHGAGNDFVVIDTRQAPAAFIKEHARLIADRRFGVGCDQVVLIESSEKAHAYMRIFNSDGSQVPSCGNASRCVASLLMQETGMTQVQIDTAAGLLKCEAADEERVTVDMGRPKLDWQDIPLARESDTLAIDVVEGELRNPVAVNMGNPHAVFFVEDTQAIHLSAIGPVLEHHAMFPEKANIEIAQIINPQTVRMRVWERGAGETLACGTGACAVLVAAHRRGLTDREADIILPGGLLHIRWQSQDEGGHVLMTGPVTQVFTGMLSL